MQRTSLFVSLLISACSSTASGVDDDRDAGADAAQDANIDGQPDAPPDALPDAPLDGPPPAVCDPTKPWGTPTLVAGVNSASRDVQAMLVDANTMFLATDRAGALNIYTSTRASEAAAWGTPQPLAGFTTTAGESSAYLTADALTMYYGRTEVNATNADIYLAVRATPSAAFGTGALVANINGADDDGDVVVTGDGNTMFFASNRNGGEYHIWTAVKGVSGSFGAPTAVTTVNSAVYDAHPRVSRDGLIMYFSSMRTATGTQGGADVWRSTRPSLAAVWSTPTLVTQLNTASNESPTFISDDDCYILLQSNRAGGTGSQDVWEAKRPL